MEHAVTASLYVDTIEYTGKNRKELMSKKFEFNLIPNGNCISRMIVEFEDYHKKLLDQVNVKKKIRTEF